MSIQSSEEDRKSHSSTFNLNAPEFKPKQKIAFTDTNNNNIDDDDHGKHDDKVLSNLKSTNVVPIYNSTPYMYYLNTMNNQIIMPPNYQMVYSNFGGWSEHNGNIAVPIQLPINMYNNNGSTLLQHHQLDNNTIIKDNNTNKLHDTTTCILNAGSTTLDTDSITGSSSNTDKDHISITTTTNTTTTTTNPNLITNISSISNKDVINSNTVCVTDKNFVSTTGSTAKNDPIISTDRDPASTTGSTAKNDPINSTDRDTCSDSSTLNKNVVITTTCNDDNNKNNNSVSILPSSSLSLSSSDSSHTVMSTNTINNNIHSPIQMASIQHSTYPYYYNGPQFPVTLSTSQSPSAQISPLTLPPNLLQHPSPIFPSQNIIFPSYSPLLSSSNVNQQHQQPMYLHHHQQQQQQHQTQLHPQQQSLLQYFVINNNSTNINQKSTNPIINNSINLKSFKFNTGDKKLDNHLNNLVQNINPDVSDVFQAKLTDKNSCFYVVKSFTEENVLLGIRHNAWCSTKNGNDVLQQAYQLLIQRNQDNEAVHLFLFFSINGSGYFSGVAEITDQLQSSNNIWTHKKWQSGYFPIHWHYIKQIPNSQLRHIKLEHNDNRPVTNSRDVTEIKPFNKGIDMLRIFHSTPYDKSLVLSFQQPSNMSFSAASSTNTTISNSAATT